MNNISYLNDLLMNSLKLSKLEKDEENYEKYLEDFKDNKAKEVKQINIQLKKLQKQIRSANNNEFGNVLENLKREYHEQKVRLNKLNAFEI